MRRMTPVSPEDARLLALAERPPRFGVGAYEFTRDAVSYASHVVFATGTHVSGPELLEAIRRLARERFGALARDVLEAWGVRRTEDFGEIVFRLVESGFLSKTEDDQPEDFRAVYSFDEAFEPDTYWRDRLGDPAGKEPPRSAPPLSESSRP
jgi:uncharacterized repeat protein (TIGR04138 family)